ncbi:threonine transporter RhtB, partial [Rhizobium ruizarguesonis]
EQFCLSTARIVLGSEKKMPLLARRCGSATLLLFSAVMTFSAF